MNNWLSRTPKNYLFLLIIIIFHSNYAYNQTINHWETVIYNTDTWRYFVGTSEPDANWRTTGFNDALWSQGPGGIGYADNDDNTIIPTSVSVYLRRKFNVTDTAAILRALLSIDYDDAFVAYINDIEIGRNGITGTHPTYNQLGTDHEAVMYQGGLPESFYIEKATIKTCMHQGDNVLAIQIHNSSQTSSDMSSNAFLSFGISNTSNNYRQVPAWFPVSDRITSSNLPIVIITTKPGETIKNEPKITADMKIIYKAGERSYIADSGNVYTGKVGIEIRGAYSASLPQKPYGFETRDNSGNSKNVTILGMPSENDWVLLANYNDKTFLRNILAFEIFRKMGNYAPRMKLCEVILNGEYQGIYLLGEKIKVDKGRINISSLNSFTNYGDEVTGGYIIKNDYYTGSDSWLSDFSPINKPGEKVYFVYHDPKPDDLTAQQKSYIKGFINSLETRLYSPYFKVPGMGYKDYIDIKSFSDYFILGEVTRNVDAYKKSRFFYKNKDSKDKLLHSGPPWDFDWAWRNLTENCIQMNKTDGSGWAYLINECSAWPVPPSWEVKMLQDNDFASLIFRRYFELRKSILSQNSLNQKIDSVAALVNEAQKRHFEKWKILGINAGTPEYGAQPATYSGEIDKFKNWISVRLAWLDINLASFESRGNESSTQVNYKMYPNPVSDKFTILADKKIIQVLIFNSSGASIDSVSVIDNYIYEQYVSHLSPGLYFVKVIFANGQTVIIKMVKN